SSGSNCRVTRSGSSSLLSVSVGLAVVSIARPILLLSINTAPEFIVRHSFSLSNALAGCVENRSEFWRVGHEQAFQLVLVARSEKHTHGPAVFRDDDG